MVEGMNVRVVRCPNCQKLLPEIGDVAVYRCGGCDATLQAKRPLRVSEVLAEVTGVQRKEFDRDSKKESVAEELERPLGMLEALPAQFDGAGHKTVEVCNGGLVVGRNESTRTDNEGNGGHNRREMVSEVSVLPKEPNLLVTGAPSKESRAETSGGKFLQVSKKTVQDQSPFANGTSGKDAIELPNAKQPVNASHAAQQTGEKGLKRNRINGFPMETGLGRSYPDEGPSNYHYPRGYRYGDYMPDTSRGMDTARRVGYLEQNRTELLRMLDELRDQVQRTCNVSDKQQANDIPVDGMAASSCSYAQHDHANWLPESSMQFNRNPSRHSPLYDYNMGMLNFHATVPVQSDIPCYPDPLGQRRAHHIPGEHPHQQGDSCLYGQFDPDLLKPYHHGSFYNQPACPCSHCHQRQFPMPAHGATAVVGQQRVPYCVNSRDFYPTDVPSICAPRGSNTRTVNAPLHSLEQRTHGRRAVRNAGPYCRPISGAAPFCICFNCYELLQLPEEPLSSKRSQFTLRCGSCSVVIPVKRVGNRIAAAAPVPVSGSHTVLDNSNNSCDNSGNDFNSTDEKLVLPYIFNNEDHEMLEKAHASSQMDTDKMLHFSSSSSPSMHRESSESLISQKGVPSSSEIASEAQMISRVSSLPLREHFAYSPSDCVVDRSGHGSRSARSDQERKISSSENPRPNLAKDVQLPIVMDVPADEYPPAGLSQDSWDIISKDEAQPRVNKAGDSFITGFIKKSLRFNQVMSHTRYKVSVNGHPIPDRVIKKAEKLAGSISPGDYWYDYRAGFWGIMGHQCLGIIPPFIEELNYPMPKKCAGGDTGILINGRELHKKDLDLLLGRGLPNTKGCSYIVDISGKVWDESSGEELDGLGKLAPTIEKLKRGFGMRCPRGVA